MIAYKRFLYAEMSEKLKTYTGIFSGDKINTTESFNGTGTEIRQISYWCSYYI